MSTRKFLAIALAAIITLAAAPAFADDKSDIKELKTRVRILEDATSAVFSAQELQARVVELAVKASKKNATVAELQKISEEIDQLFTQLARARTLTHELRASMRNSIADTKAVALVALAERGAYDAPSEALASSK